MRLPNYRQSFFCFLQNVTHLLYTMTYVWNNPLYADSGYLNKALSGGIRLLFTPKKELFPYNPVPIFTYFADISNCLCN